MAPKLSRNAAQVLLNSVSRSFDEKPVVKPLNLKIEPGEFVSLLGPSGCGKSTLLRLIAGLDQPSTGSIETKSVEIDSHQFSEKPVAKSFVFQEAALLPWRSVLQNVALPLELQGQSREAAKSKASDALSRVGLGDALDRFPNQLSGGMKMRVSVARALVAGPSLLLLDEPFAALDENTRYRLQEDLRKLWQETGVTTLFVTHSVSEAVFLSNRAVLFSSRPAEVIADMKIDLPQERTRNLRLSSAFIEQVQNLSQSFERGVHA